MSVKIFIYYIRDHQKNKEGSWVLLQKTETVSRRTVANSLFIKLYLRLLFKKKSKGASKH